MSRLTPGIASPPRPLKEYESHRVADRVHAVVRRGSLIRLTLTPIALTYDPDDMLTMGARGNFQSQSLRESLG